MSAKSTKARKAPEKKRKRLSATITPENFAWLDAAWEARGCRSKSHLVDELVAAARRAEA